VRRSLDPFPQKHRGFWSWQRYAKVLMWPTLGERSFETHVVQGGPCTKPGLNGGEITWDNKWPKIMGLK